MDMMEHVHGVDVSWMAHGAPKDKSSKASNQSKHSRKPSSQSQPRQPIGTPTAATTNTETTTASTAQPQLTSQHEAAKENTGMGNGNGMGNGISNGTSNGASNGASTGMSSARAIPTSRPSFGRSSSADKAASTNGTSPKRSSSWFSNISSKFSSPTPSPSANASAPIESASPPRSPTNKNAVLAHGVRIDGNAPYTPAPPRSNPGNLLGIFRRFSSSAGGLGQGVRGNGTTHGLVERKVLNVDPTRERCEISELNQAKLRRVAFCVDVEIAPQPRYADEGGPSPIDKGARRRLTERGEGEALKNPKCVEVQKEKDGVVKATGELLPKEPSQEGDEISPVSPATGASPSTDKAKAAPDASKEKKKEKKKKNEEGRKARKEKKRKQAEANGSIPMEIHREDSDSSTSTRPATAGSTKTTSFPTTNPVRIYRRCCQLRETPILKKLTDQLILTSNYSSDTGIVEKIDLAGYWMQLADLVTLGDYLAVVPVREIILENCSLTDEGLRVVLAGLLAAKRPDPKRRKFANYSDHSVQGGVVERVVLKNNKLGPEGWRHICLFIYMCRSLRQIDLSTIAFPHPHPHSPPQPSENGGYSANGAPFHPDIATLFSRSMGERLAQSTLELVNLGDTVPSTDQLGLVVDGAIQCGLRRLGLARNSIDQEGLVHVARFLSEGQCDHLDLGGNDLRDNMEMIGKAISQKNRLWALSLADCNLKPTSLCKILPALVKLKDFRFIDLSHNHDLFKSDPSALSVLRRYLPKMMALRRIHLGDVGMTSEQAIALAEILPEVRGLAHINLLENPELVKLSDARTEEAQEEACALYASLLAATRVSKSIICVDIEVPSEQSSEIVKALAKQVVAYCLRNMERFPVDVTTAVSSALEDSRDLGPTGAPVPYPDVLMHLVGHPDSEDEGNGNGNGNGNGIDDVNESAPDEDYVIGGTGVVKALACCLKNRGDESRRQSGEFSRELETGRATPSPRKLPPGKAKDMSKHLLVSARKIRARLQPALAKARSHHQQEDDHDLRKLDFLDQTLSGIIKRFEDEFPETRERVEAAEAESPGDSQTTPPADEVEPAAVLSDAEDDTALHVRPSSRLGSPFTELSRSVAQEEGRTLRAGHHFRVGIVTSVSAADTAGPTSSDGALLPNAEDREKRYDEMMRSLDDMAADPRHARMLKEVICDLADPALDRIVEEKGVLRTFKEDRERVAGRLRDVDPEHWERFKESQEKARANLRMGKPERREEEVAIEDEDHDESKEMPPMQGDERTK